MKKIGKLITTLAVVGGVAAGAYAIYKKFFATKEDSQDLDEDFDEIFDEDFDFPSDSKRGYVSLTPSEEPVEYSQEEIAEKQVALAEAATEEAKEDTN